MSSDMQDKNSRAANPAFKVIRSPEEKRGRTQNAISNLLATIGGSMPQGLVSAVGGPLMAGLLAVLSCMTVIAVPATYFGVKAMSAVSAGKKKNLASGFYDKLFGKAGEGVAENMMDPDSIRAMNLAQEGAHSDEDTSMGLMIPEDVSGLAGDKKGAGEDSEDDEENGFQGAGSGGVKTSAGAGRKKLDGKAMAEWKNKFGSIPSGEGGTIASAGGGTLSNTPIGQRTVGGNQIGLGAGAAGGGSSAGTMAKTGKMGTRTGSSVRSKASGGAASDLRAAANLSQKLPSIDQSVAGNSGAAFHGAPATGKIIAGQAAGVVDGGVVGGPGIADVTMPNRANNNSAGTVPPQAPDNEEGSNANAAIMVMIAAIFAGYMLSVNVVAPNARASSSGWSRALAWTAAILGTAALAAAWAWMREEEAPEWVLWVLGGLAALVASDLIYAAATGRSWINSLLGGNSGREADLDQAQVDQQGAQANYDSALQEVNRVDPNGDWQYYSAEELQAINPDVAPAYAQLDQANLALNDANTSLTNAQNALNPVGGGTTTSTPSGTSAQ